MEDGEGDGTRSCIVYSCRGPHVCREAFSCLVGLNPKAVQRHDDMDSNGSEFKLFETMHGESRTQDYGASRLKVCGFLKVFGLDHGLECPRDKGSKVESSLR